MARVFLAVLDSFGIGAAADAERFGDLGSDTLGHIAAACAAGKADVEGGRSGPLRVPHMDRLGLGAAAKMAGGSLHAGLQDRDIVGLYGYGVEISEGKDSPTGHWEIAGLPVPFDWGYFPESEPTFPKELTDEIIIQGKLPGILANKHASGTVVIDEFGQEHIRTGKPIFYTSADSVIQIAAHEEHFGLQKLYDLCEIVRVLADPLNVGRVIARPFVGESPEDFERTVNRHDYTVPPTAPTVLDRLKDAGHQVFSVGKIYDLFAGRGITHKISAKGNAALFDAMLDAMNMAGDGDLVFTNFVDFDMLYGHRRDIAGYASALEYFDRRLPEIFAKMGDDDLLILTADHGCDPGFKGTDHTREYVPILCYGPGLKSANIGRRETFADIGQTIGIYLGLDPGPHGTNFL